MTTYSTTCTLPAKGKAMGFPMSPRLPYIMRSQGVVSLANLPHVPSQGYRETTGPGLDTPAICSPELQAFTPPLVRGNAMPPATPYRVRPGRVNETAKRTLRPPFGYLAKVSHPPFARM